MLKEDQEKAISGTQKDSAREETSAVSGTMRISVQNRRYKPFHHLNHQHKEVEVRPGKRTSEATAVQRLLERYWHNFGDRCSFAHRQVEGQRGKERPKEDGDTSAVAVLKNVRQLGLRISGRRAAGILICFTEEHKSLGINSTSAILKSHTASRKHPRNKGPSLGKVPHQRSVFALNFDDRSQEETERQERCSDSLRLLHFPLSADHLLSYHPVLLPAHKLHLP